MYIRPKLLKNGKFVYLTCLGPPSGVTLSERHCKVSGRTFTAHKSIHAQIGRRQQWASCCDLRDSTAAQLCLTGDVPL